MYFITHFLALTSLNTFDRQLASPKLGFESAEEPLISQYSTTLLVRQVRQPGFFQHGRWFWKSSKDGNSCILNLLRQSLKFRGQLAIKITDSERKVRVGIRKKYGNAQLFSNRINRDKVLYGETPKIISCTSHLLLYDLADCRMASREEDTYQIQCFSCEKWLSTKEVKVSLEWVPINAQCCGLRGHVTSQLTIILPPHRCFVPYMTNYEYTCQDCGTESIGKKAASWLGPMHACNRIP